MIKLIKSSFYNEESMKKELCTFIMNAEQLSYSSYCKEFEKKFAQWQWSKYCVFVNSGSSANVAILQTLLNLWKLKKNDKVWFSSLTWATNVMPIIQLWLIPIPIDVEINSLNVSLKQIELQNTHNDLKAIFITNLLGLCDDIENIESYCNENNIILLEDNCESMGTIYKWKKLWNCFSKQ